MLIHPFLPKNKTLSRLTKKLLSCLLFIFFPKIQIFLYLRYISFSNCLASAVWTTFRLFCIFKCISAFSASKVHCYYPPNVFYRKYYKATLGINQSKKGKLSWLSPFSFICIIVCYQKLFEHISRIISLRYAVESFKAFNIISPV